VQENRTDFLQDSAMNNMPEPRDVLFQSMIIPGWGQVTNGQVWKVPVIYAMLGGLTYYSVNLTKQYHDYRAAFFNLNEDAPDDMRFGPTPEFLKDENLGNLRSTRNDLRKRRDLVYVAIGLAYGLNIIDAFVFAHMRTFDVSEDLSLKASVSPSVMEAGSPGITLSIDLFKKTK